MANHHIVPQVTLRRFATEAKTKRIVAVDRVTGKSIETTVKSVCAEGDFYTIPTHDVEDYAQNDHDPKMVEKMFSGLEEKSKGILDKMLGGEFPPPV